jgi:hypothetical protein
MTVVLGAAVVRSVRLLAATGVLAITLGGCRNDDDALSLGQLLDQNAAQPAPTGSNPPTTTPAARPPLATNDSVRTETGEKVVVRVLANDSSPDGKLLRIARVTQPPNGTATVNPDDTVTYAPRNGFVGPDSFTYTVTDDQDGSATGSVSVTVESVAATTGDALMERIAAAPEGSWINVNANRFQDVWAPVEQRARVNDMPFGEPRKIITAWGSMAWDNNRRQLIIWGGGHADYAGNEVYRLSAATLRWDRASLPSAVVASFADARFFTVDGPSNAPISSHTYDNQEFLPLVDRLITFGGAAYNTGGPFLLEDGVTRTGPYLWDPSRAGADAVGGAAGSQVDPAAFPDVVGGEMWTNRDTFVTRGIGTERPQTFVDGTSAYARDGDVESMLVSEGPTTGGDLFRYRIADIDDPSLDRWELIGPGAKSYAGQGAGAYDPQRRLYLRTARFSGACGIVMWNVANAGPNNAPLRFFPSTQDGQPVLTAMHGMDYDPVRSVFALWDGGAHVWYLAPPTGGSAFATSGWTLRRAPVAGPDAPALSMSAGILGKWKYVPTHDVMMGLGDGHQGQVWVYKPVGWRPPQT